MSWGGSLHILVNKIMFLRQRLALPQETLEKLAVELVLVLDEAQRVSDYDTEITKIENAIQEVKQCVKNIFGSKDQRLNGHLLKFVLWGILNIEGPDDNLKEKIALAFERLHSADEFIKLYGVKDSGRIQVEKCVKDAENGEKILRDYTVEPRFKILPIVDTPLFNRRF